MKKRNKINSNIFRTKLFFIFVGLFIVLVSVLFSNRLAYDLAQEEKKKIEVWVEATRFLSTTNNEGDNSINELVLAIIEGNTTIPVIIADKNKKVLDSRNVDAPKSEKKREKYYQKFIERSIQNQNEFTISLIEEYLYIYYNDSSLLQRLYYFPYIQLTIIIIFCLLAIYAFKSTKKTEENRIWVGLSRETAHQLGTPISALLAWIELLKLKHPEEKLIPDIEKDINRLLIITERFSKIGSNPDLQPVDLQVQMTNAVNYMRKRSSQKVNINIHPTDQDTIVSKLNVPLFEWVIENICKNAIDAMDGEGDIDIYISQKENKVFIDIKDNGKGLEKSNFKSIFKPGFTSKERGWGLGLSLTKRIVEDYHRGKIFVKESEKNIGTCFRIVLKAEL